MAGRPCIAALAHANVPNEACRLAEMMPNYLQSKELHVSAIGPIVGVHAGAGTIGAMAIPVPDAGNRR